MNTLAKAVLDAFLFLELSDDEDVDPDKAVQAMENITARLHDCSPAELAALKQAADDEYKAAKADKAPKEVQNFYRHFMANSGL